MIILIIILIFQLYIVVKILKYFLLSPTYIYIIFSVLSILLSLWYFYYFDDKFSLFNIDKVTSHIFLKTIKLYLLALNSFLFGIIIFYELSKKKNQINI